MTALSATPILCGVLNRSFSNQELSVKMPGPDPSAGLRSRLEECLRQ